MSLAFTLRTPPTVPLEAEVLTPARLAGLSAPEVAKLSVVHGNERADLGEFFQVQGTADGGGAGSSGSPAISAGSSTSGPGWPTAGS